jgi:hypothetical protein
LLPSGMVAPTQPGRCGARPLQVGLADRAASCAVAWPGGVLGPCHQATGRDHVLHPRAAVAVLDVIAPDPTADLADPGHRPAPGAGDGVVCCGRGEDRPLPVTEPRVVMAPQRQVPRKALVHRGRGDACRHPHPMSLVGALLGHLREGLRTSARWEVREPRRALPQERPAAPEPIAGRPHRGGRDVGLREPAATAPDRDRVGSARVMLRVAPMDGLHVEGMPPHDGTPCRSAAVGQPGPRCTGIRPRRPCRPDRGPCA